MSVKLRERFRKFRRTNEEMQRTSFISGNQELALTWPLPLIGPRVKNTLQESSKITVISFCLLGQLGLVDIVIPVSHFEKDLLDEIEVVIYYFKHLYQ